MRQEKNSGRLSDLTIRGLCIALMVLWAFAFIGLMHTVAGQVG